MFKKTVFSRGEGVDGLMHVGLVTWLGLAVVGVFVLSLF